MEGLKNLSLRIKLVTVALEVGGGWDDEAVRLIDALAYHKAQAGPAILRRSQQLRWRKRWRVALSVAASRAFATSLLEHNT